MKNARKKFTDPTFWLLGLVEFVIEFVKEHSSDFSQIVSSSQREVSSSVTISLSEKDIVLLRLLTISRSFFNLTGFD